ncbi:MAG TPA: transketolase [Spirochaetales bacterium]|nr:transketolase [Spirochaetales bacterium]HRY54263.1 transketolase [Spirochaetia bacterium]HRZ64008.1 transketolase [Spirochaetia bacterium]
MSEQIGVLQGSAGELEARARRLRRLILDTVHRAGMGHTGGSLSEVEILVALYFRVLRNIDPERPERPDRDRFILSKGHASAGLYAALALRGYFPESLLEGYDELGSPLQAHPDMGRAPGIDISTGSLGQGLSCGVGMALAAQLRPELGGFRTFVLLGDGELQEGQVWEAAEYAGALRLPGIVAVVDCNGVQLSAPTGPSLAPERIADRWRAFGWESSVVAGHDLGALVPALEAARHGAGSGPVALVARTVKGRGVSFMEGRCEWHGKAPNDEEYARAIGEVGG